MQDKFDHYRQMRAIMGNNQQLSKIQEGIVLIHSINASFGLQCINRQGEKLEYPENWKDQEIGVTKFQYLYHDKNVLFRFVNNNDNVLSVNFVPEDSDDLYQFEVEFSNQGIEAVIREYEKQLDRLKKSTVPEKQKMKEEKPKDRPILIYEHDRPQPYPYQQNPRLQNPFSLPDPSNEYVGPNHQIFNGRGNNLYVPGSMRRPPGARWQPTNPFNMDESNPRSHDFEGFNQFGVPRGGNRFGGFG